MFRVFLMKKFVFSLVLCAFTANFAQAGLEWGSVDTSEAVVSAYARWIFNNSPGLNESDFDDSQNLTPQAASQELAEADPLDWGDITGYAKAIWNMTGSGVFSLYTKSTMDVGLFPNPDSHYSSNQVHLVIDCTSSGTVKITYKIVLKMDKAEWNGMHFEDDTFTGTLTGDEGTSFTFSYDALYDRVEVKEWDGATLVNTEYAYTATSGDGNWEQATWTKVRTYNKSVGDHPGWFVLGTANIQDVGDHILEVSITGVEN